LIQIGKIFINLEAIILSVVRRIVVHFRIVIRSLRYIRTRIRRFLELRWFQVALIQGCLNTVFLYLKRSMIRITGYHWWFSTNLNWRFYLLATWSHFDLIWVIIYFLIAVNNHISFIILSGIIDNSPIYIFDILVILYIGILEGIFWSVALLFRLIPCFLVIIRILFNRIFLF